MRTWMRSKVTLLFIMLGLLLAIPAIALADTLLIRNDLNVNANATHNPGDTGTANVVLNVTNGAPTGDTNGCNASGSNPLTASLSSNNADVTFPSGNTATITGCGITVPVSYKVDANSNGGTAVISASVSGGVPSTTTNPRTYDTSDTLTITIPDIKKPTVTAVSPLDGATNVAKGTNVEATFSEAMDAATLNDAEGDGNFTLKKTSDNSLVGAVVSYNATNTKATLNPSGDLAYNTQYTATVTTGAKDLAGNALDQDGAAGTQDSKTWTFTTEPPPNTAPATTDPTFNPASPKTNDILQASTTTTDADNNNVSVAWVWKVTRSGNTCEVKTETSSAAAPGARTSSLNLSQSHTTTNCTGANPGTINPSKGDTVVVEATPNDGTVNGTMRSSSVVIANSAPTCAAVSLTTNEEATGIANPSCTDADGDTLTYSIVAQGTKGTASVTTSGQLQYAPTANENGSDSFTYKANDGTAFSDPATVNVTINPVNDEPSFTAGGNVTVNEDSGAYSAAWATGISAGPANESGQTVSFHVSNNNNALFSSQPAISSSGTLTFTPEANAFGTATVSVYAQDSGGTDNGGDDTTATQTFTITVNGVNDAPSFTKGADENVLEDSGTAGAHTVSGWATSISAGPNESGQQLTFEVTNNSNTALFSTQPSVSSTGTLTYTLAPNANGEAEVTLRLTDDGGTANGGVDTSATQTFKITVTAVNDAPSFDLKASPNQTVLLNAGAQSVDNFAINFSPGPSNESDQALLKYVVTITNTNNTNLFSEPPAIDNTGKLTYKLAQDAIGTATVSVQVQDDGGTANGGKDTSTPAKTFTIDVNYGFSGFLQPINWTAHQVLDTNVSTFKGGSTVPVKFYLTDANGNRIVQPVNAQWTTPQKGSATNQAIDEGVYTDPATSGSLYKWDSTAQQYIYNWSTKGVAAGFYYKIGVTLPDGNTHYTYISLR
jgi:VCBS repeat-containing protein